MHTNKEGGDGWVLRRLQLRQVVGSAHHLFGHRVVHAKVAVLDVLGGQLPGRRHFVPIGTLCSPLALTLDKETADWSSVSLRRGINNSVPADPQLAANNPHLSLT